MASYEYKPPQEINPVSIIGDGNDIVFNHYISGMSIRLDGGSYKRGSKIDANNVGVYYYDTYGRMTCIVWGSIPNQAKIEPDEPETIEI